jgi:hypothetical protein
MEAMKPSKAKASIKEATDSIISPERNGPFSECRPLGEKNAVNRAPGRNPTAREKASLKG